MRLIVSCLALSLSLVSALPAAARDPQLDVGGFREEDRPVAEAIAGFDASDRHAALIASGHPEELLAMSQIQRRSSEQFAKLIEGLSREDQEKIWEIVRQPGLVADLARGGAKSESELDAIAARHPEAIRPLVRSEGGKRYSTWVEVFAIDLEAERAFADVVAKQPSGVKDAFVRLRGRPDLTTVLVDNVGVATRVGAAYRADPTRVEARFDDLSHEVQAKRSADAKSWSNELADPKARESLQSTAQTFAKDHGYDLNDPNDPSNTRPAQTQVVYVNANPNPYPYWYGYPSWYAYPYWYPATVWTHLGFRYGAGGTFIGFGLPSPYFLGWYNNAYAGYGYGGYGYGFGFGGYPGWGYYRGPGYGYWGGYPGYGYGGGWGGGWGGGRHRSHHNFNSGNYYSHHYPRVFEGNRQLPSSGGSPGGFVGHHGHHGNSGGGPVVFGNAAPQGGAMPNGGQIGHHGNRGHHGSGGGFNGGGPIGHHGNRGHHGGFGGGGGMGGGGFGGGGFGGGGGGGHGGGHHR